MLMAAQERQAKAYNSRRRVEDERAFEEGQKVLVNTRNIRLLARLKQGETRRLKMTPRYMGPFTVIQKINFVAYRVALPAHMKMHDVFHVSLLREYQPSRRTQPPPPPLEIEGE